jgi:hypothetical protein
VLKCGKVTFEGGEISALPLSIDSILSELNLKKLESGTAGLVIVGINGINGNGMGMGMGTGTGAGTEMGMGMEM